MPTPRLLELRTGRVALRDGHRTAYAKAPRSGPVSARALGLDGDEVGNPRVHGGPEKAIYAYGAGAYASWIADHPQHADRLVPFDDPRMTKAMVRNGLSGWYLRVLQEGEMTAGDALLLEHRPQGAWSITRALEASYRSPPDRAELGDLAKADGLASTWAAWAAGMAEADKPRAKPL